MKATLLTYSLAKKSQKIRDQLRMVLIGHTNRSNWGKYVYKKEGLLHKTPHIKISKGTIIFPLKETNKIIKILKRYKAEIKTYEIEIKKSVFN